MKSGFMGFVACRVPRTGGRQAGDDPGWPVRRDALVAAGLPAGTSASPAFPHCPRPRRVAGPAPPRASGFRPKSGITTRPLRRSLNLGRLASPEELDRDGDDRGIANHIPLLNRLAVWWKRLRRDGRAESLTRYQKDALLADFQGVAAILDELRK